MPSKLARVLKGLDTVGTGESWYFLTLDYLLLGREDSGLTSFSLGKGKSLWFADSSYFVEFQFVEANFFIFLNLVFLL